MLGAALLCGCATAPPPPTDTLPPAWPAAYRHADDLPTSPWPALGDAELTALARRAGRDDPRVGLAAARLAQARALLEAADASARPQLQATLGAARSGGPLLNDAGGQGTLWTARLQGSLAPDLAGTQDATRRAAQAEALAREAQWQDARLQAQAEAAATALALRAADAELALVAAEAARLEALQAGAQRRAEAGLAPATEALTWLQARAALEAERLALARQRAQRLHALAVLLGEPASGFELPPAALPADLPPVPAGLPSALLERRADLVAARRGLQAAQARQQAAEASAWPALRLTADGGLAAPELGRWLRGSALSWGLGALLTLPGLDGGRQAAVRAQAASETEAAAAAWRGRVVVALQEVEDQLVARQRLAEAEVQLAAARSAAARQAEGARARLARGLADRDALLRAERELLQRERAWLQGRAARWLACVGLVRALGGGWDQIGPS